MNCEHDFKNEFSGSFSGDKTCVKCGFVVYSRESKRLEYFGLAKVVNGEVNE